MGNYKKAVRTMIGYKVIDMETYPRRAHLEYFMGMVHPQMNITADVDVTDLKRFCKEQGCSFFLAFLHVVALSADSIPQFRQRIHKLTADTDGSPASFEVREYEQSPTSHTEATGNEMYCYCCLNHHMPWAEYIESATKIQQQARETGTLDEDDEIEAFYFPTCLPWFYYRECMHPMADRYDSNPRLSWGKFEENFRGRLMMPLTVAVHHGLVDGLHVGKLFERVEKNMAALIDGTLDYKLP